MTDVTSSIRKIQVEETQFNSAVSEALVQKMAGTLNGLIDFLIPIGSVMPSTLTEAQFQAEAGTNWVLADGGSAAGTDWETLTGLSALPDYRGEFLRGSDNGRGVDSGRALNSTQSENIGSHNHQWYDHQGILADAYTYDSSGNTILGSRANYTSSATAWSKPVGSPTVVFNAADNDYDSTNFPTEDLYTSNSSGGTGDNRPRNVSVNYFIKVDRTA